MFICSAVALALQILFHSDPSIGRDSGGTQATTPSPAMSLSCLREGACRVERESGPPKCQQLRIVETVPTTEPKNAEECVLRSYWLIQGETEEAILLANACVAQVVAAELGEATTRLTGCKLQIRYVEFLWDKDCVVRNLQIDLRTLQVLGQFESKGTSHGSQCRSRPATRHRIRLPRGTGKPGSPLVVLDQPEDN